jgi:hypothetical protein
MKLKDFNKAELGVFFILLAIVIAIFYVGLVINTPWWLGCETSVTPAPACG